MFRVFPLIMLWFVIRRCDCQITYDLTVHGEAQHGYYITILLGTPPQTINLLLDTGSSNIAVAAVPPISHSSKYFHYNESTTLRQLDIAVDLRYIVGQWNGFLAKEVIKFNNTILECTIACMLSIDKVFDDSSQFQGLLGLAYPSIAIPDSSVHPFMNTLITAQNISDIFCLDLCGPYFTSKKQMTQCGKLQIGHISDVYSNDEIVYTPVVKEWYYEIMLTDFRVGLNHVPVHCSELNKGRSVIDSGTTDLYLPESVYHWTITKIKQNAHVLSSKFWLNETVACVPKLQIEIFPTITLTFYHTKNSTFDLVVSPELYLLPIEEPATNFTCFKLAFGSSDDGVLIGSSVLKGFYAVFDRQNKRIGFANSSYFRNQNNFSGFVAKPKYTNKNIELCKKENTSSYMYSEASLVMISTIFPFSIVTCILLYMFVSGKFKQLLRLTDPSAERNSLMAKFGKHGNEDIDIIPLKMEREV